MEEQLDNAYAFLEKGIYTPEIFIQRKEKLTEEMAALHTDLQSMIERYENILTIQRSQEEFLPKVRGVIDAYWTVSDMQTRNDMLKELLEKIEYKKDIANTRGKRENANFTLDIYPRLPRKSPIS